jgi:hypothetical protein
MGDRFQRVMLTLRPEVVEVLDRAAASRRRSAYVAGLVMEHNKAWRGSFALPSNA